STISRLTSGYASWNASTLARASGLVSWIPKPHSTRSPDASPSAGGTGAAGVAWANALGANRAEPASAAPASAELPSIRRRDIREEEGPVGLNLMTTLSLYIGDLVARLSGS